VIEEVWEWLAIALWWLIVLTSIILFMIFVVGI